MYRHEHDSRAVVKNGRVKFIIAFLVLFLVFIGLNTALFASLGILKFHTPPPTGENLNVTIEELDLELNGAQQGVHFLEGAVVSVILAHPLTGFGVGILKEIFDTVGHIENGSINKIAFQDSLLDVFFWTLGGFAGYYALVPLHGYFIRNNVRGLRGLVTFLRNKKYKNGEDNTGV